MILSAFLWWLVLQLLGLMALPLTWCLFARLPGRGYALAKPLGLLLAAFFLWLGGTFRLLPNTAGGGLGAVAGLAALSSWLGRRAWHQVSRSTTSRRPILGWLRANWPLVLSTELLFLLVFVGWTVFRAYNPDIAGTEKPMEFAFVNGVLGSRFFPPHDPWLSGYAISYYYFGYVMLGMLIRLTGVEPAVGFNLGVASWYALAMVGAFGVAYELVKLAESGRGGSGWGRSIRYGLLGALLVGFIGNLEGLVEVAYNRGWLPLAWIQWLDIKNLTSSPPSGTWTGGFWWWWRASRVVHDKDLLGNSVEVIDEFPFFSFLLGDMHPHVLALPFALLAIGLALNLLLSSLETQGPKLEVRSLWHWLGDVTGLRTPGILLYAVTLGALAFLNTWDFPIYVALATLALGAGLAVREGLTWGVVSRAASGAVIFALLGWLCYLPFYMGFQSQLGGVLPNLLFPTRLSQFLLMFGPFLVVVVFLFALLSLEPGRPVAGTGDAQGQVTELRPDVRYPILRQVLRLLPWTIGLPLLLVVLIILGFAILPQGRAYAETLLQDPAVAANVGGHSLAQLAGLVARVRLATPWTFLLLAGLIAWSGAILWARLSAKGAVQQGSGQAAPANGLTQSDLFAVLMVGLALLLTLSVEFVYLRDLFGTRMNTVFKFYYQAWVLLGLAAAYGLSRLAVATTPRGLKVPGLVLAGLLIAGCLCYPVAAIPSKADGFQAEPTLDGLAYLRRYNPGDMAAIEWLRANVPPTAVVLEASGGSYSPEGAGRVSMATGNPTLLGWDFHEMQWRGKAYNDLTAGRLEALERIYRTARPEELPGLLARWGIDYVYVGALERNKYGIGDASLARFDRSLKLVYDRDGVKIYAAR